MLDERWDPRASSPGEPSVEHVDGVIDAVLEHEPELLLEQAGSGEAVAEPGDPHQLR